MFLHFSAEGAPRESLALTAFCRHDRRSISTVLPGGEKIIVRSSSTLDLTIFPSREVITSFGFKPALSAGPSLHQERHHDTRSSFSGIENIAAKPGVRVSNSAPK